MNLSLQPSVGAERFDLASVLRQANAYKHAHGDDIWGNYPFTPDEVQDMIASGGMYTALVDGVVVGCVKLTEEDERIWGEEGIDNTALYIHRLATADAYRGQRLGGKIISFAGVIATEMGKKSLRLDCPSDNVSLCGYYQDEGFSFVRSLELPARSGKRIYRPSLFQKSL